MIFAVIQQLNMSRFIREHDRFEALHHPIQHMQQEQEQEQGHGTPPNCAKANIMHGALNACVER